MVFIFIFICVVLPFMHPKLLEMCIPWKWMIIHPISYSLCGITRQKNTVHWILFCLFNFEMIISVDCMSAWHVWCGRALVVVSWCGSFDGFSNLNSFKDRLVLSFVCQVCHSFIVCTMQTIHMPNE